jgi:polysaccharide pyruvyl transferase WcaK-like protein
VNCASFLSCRDRSTSADAVRAIIPRAHVIEHVDDALHVEYPVGDTSRILDRFGLKSGGYICAGFRRNASVDFDGHHAERMVSILQDAHDVTGLPIVLLPQGKFDLPALQELKSKLGPIAILPDLSDWMVEILTLASNGLMMIATPHHSLIFALRGRVPIISPVSGSYYWAKNTGSMANFELQDFVIDLSGDDYRSLAQVAIQRILKGEARFLLHRSLNKVASDSAGVEAKFTTAIFGRSAWAS